jgi:hypothetical protein
VTHSTRATNPTGGACRRRADTQPALDTHLMERVGESETRRRAWKRVKAGPAARARRAGRLRGSRQGRGGGQAPPARACLRYTIYGLMEAAASGAKR